MAFGAGVLISALAFELMDEAYKRGGFDSTAIGFVSGAVVYTAANWFLSYQGAKHRKRSGEQQPSEEENSGSGMAMSNDKPQASTQSVHYLMVFQNLL
ncbi:MULTISPECIES: hypothetical protein [unclassified Nostoc]|uniref:hypothetical protein n=1 Tax=unclassified Nostoc TaxID=2593658 RepID=UPI001C8AEA95|nr:MULTISPECIES: hypothetical protein [unclassified Nostoc]